MKSFYSKCGFVACEQDFVIILHQIAWFDMFVFANLIVNEYLVILYFHSSLCLKKVSFKFYSYDILDNCCELTLNKYLWSTKLHL